MKRIFGLLLSLFALPAFAYDITATMAPVGSGASLSSSCRLVLNGTAQVDKPCGSPQTFPGLVTVDGTYTFQYRGVNAAGASNLSPATTVQFVTAVTPPTPTNPPGITVTCTPSPCPATLTITITP